jgi:Fe2+ or Zn2+ uptake regulation protein
MGKNKSFHAAYAAAASELEALLKEQDRTEERILALRKTMNALATLISQHEGEDRDFFDYASAWMRELVDTSVTQDISRVINASAEPLTASEIRAELNELGGSMAEQSNPLATIHAVLNRLAESGRAQETIKNGKKAWCRIERPAPIANAIAARIKQSEDVLAANAARLSSELAKKK